MGLFSSHDGGAATRFSSEGYCSLFDGRQRPSFVAMLLEARRKCTMWRLATGLAFWPDRCMPIKRGLDPTPDRGLLFIILPAHWSADDLPWDRHSQRQTRPSTASNRRRRCHAVPFYACHLDPIRYLAQVDALKGKADNSSCARPTSVPTTGQRVAFQ